MLERRGKLLFSIDLTASEMASLDGIIPIPHTIHSSAVDFSEPPDSSNLKSKTILVTGGASGLGAACFKSWATHDATVIIGDINEPAGNALVEKTRTSTGNHHLHFLKLNVTDWSSQVSFFKEACKLSPHGGIDCVIANAGIVDPKGTQAFEDPPDYQNMENPPAPALRILDINLNAVMYTTALATSYLSRNPGSEKCSLETKTHPRDRHLMLVSSLAGLTPVVGQSIYAASKHGVVGLFRSLRVNAPIAHGVRINMIHPYFVDTPLLGVIGNLVLAGGGLAEVDSVVDAATRLVTDQSIIGRGLAIGPEASMDEARKAGFDIAADQGGRQAVWDVYAHDFEQSDVFTRRIVALTNLKADERGWTGLFSDIGWAISSPLRRLMGA